MPLVINTNVDSITPQWLLSQNTRDPSKDKEQLSSDYRINHTPGDTAGFKIPQKLQAQYSGVKQAIQNSQDGLNLLSATENTLNIVQDNLQRIRELALKITNDENDTIQRAAIKQEIDVQLANINRITKARQFNGVHFLQNIKMSFNLQVGANDTGDPSILTLASALDSVTTTSLGLTETSTIISSNSNACTFLANVDSALANISTRRITISLFKSQLQSAISNLQIANQNYQATGSQIIDVDTALVTVHTSQNKILQHAPVRILSQSDKLPLFAFRLIG